MLIRKATYPSGDDKVYQAFAAALGATETKKVTWPLPNLQPILDTDYWKHQSLHPAKASLYAGQMPINGEWASLHIEFVDEMELLKGGFAVAYFGQFMKGMRVEYYRWCACSHVFSAHKKGNCWWGYVCTSCGSSFDIDSSD